MRFYDFKSKIRKFGGAYIQRQTNGFTKLIFAGQAIASLLKTPEVITGRTR